MALNEEYKLRWQKDKNYILEKKDLLKKKPNAVMLIDKKGLKMAQMDNIEQIIL